MKCPKCGKEIPFTIPPYLRVCIGKNGELKPSPNICKCDRQMYELMVLKLIKRWKKATQAEESPPQEGQSEHRAYPP